MQTRSQSLQSPRSSRSRSRASSTEAKPTRSLRSSQKPLTPSSSISKKTSRKSTRKTPKVAKPKVTPKSSPKKGKSTKEATPATPREKAKQPTKTPLSSQKMSLTKFSAARNEQKNARYAQAQKKPGLTCDSDWKVVYSFQPSSFHRNFLVTERNGEDKGEEKHVYYATVSCNPEHNTEWLAQKDQFLVYLPPLKSTFWCDIEGENCMVSVFEHVPQRVEEFFRPFYAVDTKNNCILSKAAERIVRENLESILFLINQMNEANIYHLNLHSENVGFTNDGTWKILNPETMCVNPTGKTKANIIENSYFGHIGFWKNIDLATFALTFSLDFPAFEKLLPTDLRNDAIYKKVRKAHGLM